MKNEELDYFEQKLQEKENEDKRKEMIYAEEYNKDFNLFSKDNHNIFHEKKKSEFEFINQSNLTMNNNQTATPSNLQ